MLEHADAAILIGDPALFALEERANRFERTGEELVYHDLSWEWKSITGLPFVSAVWGAAPTSLLDERISNDFIQSRNHGLENLDSLVTEWSNRLPISEQTVRSYLTANIHYILDEECLQGMREFFRIAASLDILPKYTLSIPEPVL
jgi:chorismate dehydratase